MSRAWSSARGGPSSGTAGSGHQIALPARENRVAFWWGLRFCMVVAVSVVACYDLAVEVGARNKGFRTDTNSRMPVVLQDHYFRTRHEFQQSVILYSLVNYVVHYVPAVVPQCFLSDFWSGVVCFMLLCLCYSVLHIMFKCAERGSSKWPMRAWSCFTPSTACGPASDRHQEMQFGYLSAPPMRAREVLWYN